MEVAGQMQFTLVAFYGPKPPNFARLIRFCQDELSRLLISSFHPYDIEQVHGTLIGLEGVRQNGVLLNNNFWNHCSEKRFMDLRQIPELLSATSFLPMKLRIGGFRHYEKQAFKSQGRHPYLRSFSVQKNIAVAMGWPVDSCKLGPKQYPLDRFRRSFQKINILHKFHKTKTDKDDDFFFVLGRVDRCDGDEFHIQKTEEILRTYMAGIQPFDLTLNLENLFVVGFLDTQLPIATSRPFTIKEVMQPAVQDKIMALYAKPQ